MSKYYDKEKVKHIRGQAKIQSEIEKEFANAGAEVKAAMAEVKQELEGVFGEDFVKQFKNLGRELTKEFSNLELNKFNRPVKDMQPYNMFEDDNGYVFVIHTLGLGKNDINVNLKNKHGIRQLHVSGQKTLEELDYKLSSDVIINLTFDEKILGVSYKVEDGITTVYIEVEQDDSDEIQIKYMNT